MLEFLARLLAFQWRRDGAALREVDLSGCRVWYAEFAPRPERPAPGARRGRPARIRPASAGRRRPSPTLVLLHGLGATAASFFPVIPALRHTYRVIVPDLPGNGWSRPPEGRAWLTFPELLEVTERLVDRVAPEGAFLAGNSMGGWLAAKLAARRPDLVRGLALLNPGGPALHAEDWADFGQALTADHRAAVAELVARLFHRPPLATRLLGRDIRRLLRAPSVLQLVSSLQAEDFVTAEEAAGLACPSVLIWGENDRLIPEGCRDFFLEQLPRVRYEPVPDCGHCPQLECPRRTAEILLQLPRMRRRAGGGVAAAGGAVGGGSGADGADGAAGATAATAAGSASVRVRGAGGDAPAAGAGAATGRSDADGGRGARAGVVTSGAAASASRRH
ncbi:MAG: alpha/beta fold hydrolase [Anaeromyxobacter sp.]